MLVVTNALILVIGVVFDISVAILLFTPIFLPLAVATAVDPTHFGLSLVTNDRRTDPFGGHVGRRHERRHQSAGGAVFRDILPYLTALLGSPALLAAGAAIP